MIVIVIGVPHDCCASPIALIIKGTADGTFPGFRNLWYAWRSEKCVFELDRLKVDDTSFCLLELKNCHLCSVYLKKAA